MRRLATLALLLGLGLAARFAAFSVEPFGAQRVNLDTGVTILPQGGVLTDNENGLRLKGGYIEYLEGSFVRAKAVELLSRRETFLAESLEHDIPKQEARFAGLTFSNPDFKNLKAQRALALFAEDVVVLKGKVRAEKPSLQAETLVVDLRNREALILGPFAFQEGRSILRGQEPTAKLYLRFRGGRIQTTSQPPQKSERLEVLAKKTWQEGGP